MFAFHRILQFLAVVLPAVLSGLFLIGFRFQSPDGEVDISALVQVELRSLECTIGNDIDECRQKYGLYRPHCDEITGWCVACPSPGEPGFYPTCLCPDDTNIGKKWFYNDTNTDELKCFDYLECNGEGLAFFTYPKQTNRGECFECPGGSVRGSAYIGPPCQCPVSDGWMHTNIDGDVQCTKNCLNSGFEKVPYISGYNRGECMEKKSCTTSDKDCNTLAQPYCVGPVDGVRQCLYANSCSAENGFIDCPYYKPYCRRGNSDLYRCTDSCGSESCDSPYVLDQRTCECRYPCDRTTDPTNPHVDCSDYADAPFCRSPGHGNFQDAVCVPCDSQTTCDGDPTRPICFLKFQADMTLTPDCRHCQSHSDCQFAGRPPLCFMSSVYGGSALEGMCGEACTTSAECTDAARPICYAGICGPTLESGTCTGGQECSGTTPICIDGGACKRCDSDDECLAIGQGLCSDTGECGQCESGEINDCGTSLHPLDGKDCTCYRVSCETHDDCTPVRYDQAHMPWNVVGEWWANHWTKPTFDFCSDTYGVCVPCNRDDIIPTTGDCRSDDTFDCHCQHKYGTLWNCKDTWSFAAVLSPRWWAPGASYDDIDKTQCVKTPQFNPGR